VSTADHVRVCLALTARNAAATLPRLASSLDGVIDEWFIVDAGSTDDTAAVAAEAFARWPGEVYPGTWSDDRTNAETLLGLAAKLPAPTHLLLVDQDDVVEVDPSFHHDLAATDAHRLMVPVRHRLFEHRQALLVRTGPTWTYGTQGYRRLQAAAPVATANLDSLRVVRLDDRADRHEVLDERLGQLVEQLSAEGSDADLAFEVALHYRDLGRWDEAAEAFRQTLALGADPDVAFYCVYQIGEMHLFAERLAEAAWSYLEAVQLDPLRVEPFHRLGRLLNDQARWEAAAVWLERGAMLGRAPRGVFPETWVSAWGIDFELAIARWWTGSRLLARRTFEDRLARPDLPGPYRRACEHNLSLGGPGT